MNSTVAEANYEQVQLRKRASPPPYKALPVLSKYNKYRPCSPIFRVF